jgi:hypothetical protein
MPKQRVKDTRNNRVDNTRASRVEYVSGDEQVEPAVRKLILEKLEMRRRRRHLDNTEKAIDIALGIVGFNPERQALRDGFMQQAQLVDKYEGEQLFKGMNLADACLQILGDFAPRSLDKNEAEYYLTVGAYPFNTEDPTNSTEITLRKLASDHRCGVDRGKGSTPSTYRSLKGVNHGVENQGATKT